MNDKTILESEIELLRVENATLKEEIEQLKNTIGLYEIRVNALLGIIELRST